MSTCTGFSCGTGKTLKATPGSITCATAECTPEECCDTDSSGSATTCESDFNCNAGERSGYIRKDPLGTCAGETCSEEECCDKTCLGFDTCGTGKTLKATPGSITCSGTTCTPTECCDTDSSGDLASRITTLEADVTGIKSNILAIETNITTLQGDVTKIQEKNAKAWYSSFSDMFGSEETFSNTEGFANRTNKLFFIFALLIILYFCLQK
tara:strand:- start:289 stop:921 length:633 start_codon:yes stop_codon:yes gene_type:complete